VTRITRTFHEDQCTSVILCRSVFRMRNVSDGSCVENRYTHFMFNNFFLKKIMTFEKMWKNI